MTETTFWILGFISGAGLFYSIGEYRGKKKVADLAKGDVQNLKGVIDSKYTFDYGPKITPKHNA